jgi:hypothetical protein
VKSCTSRKLAPAEPGAIGGGELDADALRHLLRQPPLAVEKLLRCADQFDGRAHTLAASDIVDAEAST